MIGTHAAKYFSPISFAFENIGFFVVFLYRPQAGYRKLVKDDGGNHRVRPLSRFGFCVTMFMVKVLRSRLLSSRSPMLVAQCINVVAITSSLPRRLFHAVGVSCRG